MSIKYKIIIPIALGALMAAGCNSSVSDNQQPAPSADNSQTQPAPVADSSQTGQADQNTTTPVAASQKFTDQSYYKMSYLISGPTLSADAKMALTGFTMSKQTLTDGNTQITLKALKSEYHDQQYTLRPGDQLYFIEKFLGDDDNEANEDKNMGDDEAMIVDNQGNVVGQPQGWTTSQ